MLGRIFTKEYMYMYIGKNLFSQKPCGQKSFNLCGSIIRYICLLLPFTFWAVFGLNKSVQKCLHYNIVSYFNAKLNAPLCSGKILKRLDGRSNFQTIVFSFRRRTLYKDTGIKKKIMAKILGFLPFFFFFLLNNSLYDRRKQILSFLCI